MTENDVITIVENILGLDPKNRISIVINDQLYTDGDRVIATVEAGEHQIGVHTKLFEVSDDARKWFGMIYVTPPGTPDIPAIVTRAFPLTGERMARHAPAAWAYVWTKYGIPPDLSIIMASMQELNKRRKERYEGLS